MSLHALFEPDSAAVVGASGTEGKIGHAAMRNVVGFDGPVHPVNPKRAGETLFERDVVGSVADVDGDVDLALVCVPPPVVPEVIEECGEAGVGGAVIYSGGYSEAGEKGADLEAKVAKVANASGVSLLGPNTSGFVNPAAGLCASFVPHMERVEDGPVAVVAQSGGINHAVAFEALSEERGVSKAIGLGNRANTGFAEVVEFLDGDDGTESVVLHVEGVDDARQFLEACGRVDLPVAAYKVGREDVDSFAASHTGAMTGDYDLYQAGFEQYGVVTADSCTEVFDAGNALAKSPEPCGTNVGVVSAQAGPGIAMADRLKRAGATLPDLAGETQAVIDDLVPDITYTDNPVDTGRPMADIDKVIAAVAADEAIDIVLVYELYEEGVPYPVEGLTRVAAEHDKPLLFATDGPWDELEPEVATLEDAGIPSFVTPERGADAAGALVQYARRNGRPAGVTTLTDAAEEPIERAQTEGRSRLTEVEAKRVLASAGIEVPAHELASSPDGAVDAAHRLGYPVVLKVSAPAVRHKTEWGDGAGVALGLESPDAVRQAASCIFAAAESRDVAADVLVEEAVDTDDGVETIVGGMRHDSFGPVVVFGLGGTFAEALGDTSYRLAPVSTREARDMLDDIDAAAVLDGYRGRPAIDRPSLAETVRTVGDLLVEHESVSEVEMNPLLATTGEPVALDALATFE